MLNKFNSKIEEAISKSKERTIKETSKVVGKGLGSIINKMIDDTKGNSKK